jgi:hypothetical protein
VASVRRLRCPRLWATADAVARLETSYLSIPIAGFEIEPAAEGHARCVYCKSNCTRRQGALGAGSMERGPHSPEENISRLPLDATPLFEVLRSQLSPPSWRTLACRAAIRGLAFALPDLLAWAPNVANTVVLAAFRAASVSRFIAIAGQNFTQFDSDPPHSAAQAAYAASTLIASERARKALSAVADAAEAASIHTASMTQSDGLRAAVSAITNSLAVTDVPTLVLAINADFAALKRGALASDVARAPLFADRGDSPFTYGLDEPVWDEWLEDVIAGSPRSLAWEMAFTDFAGALPWMEGSEAVHHTIAERIAALSNEESGELLRDGNPPDPTSPPRVPKLALDEAVRMGNRHRIPRGASKARVPEWPSR